MDIDKMLKEWMKPQTLMHALTGVGLGMVVLALVPTLSSMGLTLGVVVVVVGLLGEMLVK